MKKVILRIVVTLLILAAIGVSVWLIFYKPSDNLSVFNNYMEFNKKDGLNLNFSNANQKLKDAKTITINSNVYTFDVKGLKSGDNSSEFQAEVFSKIKYYRSYMLLGENVGSNDADFYNIFGRVYNQSNANLKFEVINTIITEQLEYYISYAQLSTGVPSDVAKNVNKIINTLKNEYNDFSNKVDEIVSLQKQLTSESETIANEILALYDKAFDRYLSIIKTKTQLAVSLQNYVKKYVFDGNIIYDATSIKVDIIVKAAEQFTKQTFDKSQLKLVYKTDTANTELKNLNFANFEYDIYALNDISINTKTIQYYIDLMKIEKLNNHALTGTNNIFTLTREQKHELVENGTGLENYYLGGQEEVAKAIKDITNLFKV